MNEDQHNFFELVRTYPSPHNGQPMVLERLNDSTFRILFETDRGLSATPISHLFSFVTVGVFTRHIELCADALGHTTSLELSLPPLDSMAKPGRSLECGVITIKWNSKAPDDNVKSALEFRQTSRKKYSKGLSSELQEKLINLTDTTPLQLKFVSPKLATDVIWLNQRAVFDDMFDGPVRKELAHWLRTSHAEKIEKKDGLSYDCMEMNGPLLRFILKHYRILRWPVVSKVLQSYYTRTMSDSSTVGYVEAPFETPNDSYMVGRLVTEIWHELSKQQYYLHPFGTVVSNNAAHADFLQLLHASDEQRSKNYVTFIFRAGHSATPHASERLPMEHLTKGV
jgi:hypothetical protein